MLNADSFVKEPVARRGEVFAAKIAANSPNRGFASLILHPYVAAMAPETNYK